MSSASAPEELLQARVAQHGVHGLRAEQPRGLILAEARGVLLLIGRHGGCAAALRRGLAA